MPIVFAYGSNINHHQMKSRCPSARFLGVRRLNGFRLDFVGYSRGWGGGVATIKSCKGATTEGVAWEVSQADLHELDRHEGVPYCYQRITGIQPHTREVLEIYIHSGSYQNAPSPSYVAMIVEGMKASGIARRKLRRVVRRLAA